MCFYFTFFSKSIWCNCSKSPPYPNHNTISIILEIWTKNKLHTTDHGGGIFYVSGVNWECYRDCIFLWTPLAMDEECFVFCTYYELSTLLLCVWCIYFYIFFEMFEMLLYGDISEFCGLIQICSVWYYDKPLHSQAQWPLLLTWINFNPSMDK